LEFEIRKTLRIIQKWIKKDQIKIQEEIITFLVNVIYNNLEFSNYKKKNYKINWRKNQIRKINWVKLSLINILCKKEIDSTKMNYSKILWRINLKINNK
jgi:hypothetical protein